MEDGFVIVPNSLLDSDVWNKREKYNKLDAYIYLVKEARWQKTRIKVKNISCGRNQLVRSYKELMSDWNLGNKNEVKRYLDYLQKGGWIDMEVFPNATLITILRNDECNGNVTDNVTANVTVNTNGIQGVTDSVVTGNVTGNVTDLLPQTPSSRTQVVLSLFDDSVDNKQQEEKTKSLLNPPKGKPLGYENFDFSFVDDKFYDVFVKWLDYKRSGGGKKFLYKTQKTLETCYEGIVKTSKGIPEAASEMLTYCITGGYQGFFAPRGFWWEWEHGNHVFEIEQPTQVSSQTESTQQKFYAFNVAFDTEKEADAFYDEQEKIREGVYNGTYRVADNHVDDWIAQGNAVKVVDGIVYHYDV